MKVADKCANRAEERLRVALRDLDERDRDISALQQQGLALSHLQLYCVKSLRSSYTVCTV